MTLELQAYIYMSLVCLGLSIVMTVLWYGIMMIFEILGDREEG